MKKLKRAKGLTLIELIISIAILGFVGVSFLTLFTGGFTSIIYSGKRTEALTEAQKAIDLFYKTKNIDSILDIEDSLDSTTSPANVTTYTPNIRLKFCISNELVNSINYRKLDVVVFYQGGKKYVNLTSLVP